MEFVRRLGIPVLTVLAWSSAAQPTELGSEFIIVERRTVASHSCLGASVLEYMVLQDDSLRGLPLQGKQDDHIQHLEYYKYMLPYKTAPYLSWSQTCHSATLLVIPIRFREAENGKISYRRNMTSD